MNKMGFGFLRLPLENPEDERSVDLSRVCALVDCFIEGGGTYFDTAYTYLRGGSEAALREALVKRYPRSAYRIADKLPTWKIKGREDRQRYFDVQLERCGVDYFDVYLLHGLNRENYEICTRFDLFDFLYELKARGLARRIGFSYHDSPELLEEILSAHPGLDCVLLQINYLDWESDFLQSRRLYETALRHGLRVLVMEPVKGGTLAKLPEEIAAPLRDMHPDWSMAGWALRFAQGLEGVETVLSGMNELGQVEENLAQISPLNAAEREALLHAAQRLRSAIAVNCTGCGYCEAGCPQGIAIARYFALYNEYARDPKEEWKLEAAYEQIARARGGAGDCIGCGTCEGSCPQKLPIIENLKRTAQVFERGWEK